VLGRDRGADRAQEPQIVGPGRHADHDGRERRCRQRGSNAHRHSPPSPREQRPAEEQAGLDLDEGTGCGRSAEPLLSVEPSPAQREQQEEQRADLAEADSVEHRPVEPAEEQDQPADVTRDRERRDSTDERRRREPQPDPHRDLVGQEREGHHRQRERWRVQVDRKPPSRLNRRVVEGLPVEDALARPDVGLEVVTQVVAGRQQGHEKPDGGHDRRGNRQEAADAGRGAHSAHPGVPMR
jgi:hypothetical protein